MSIEGITVRAFIRESLAGAGLPCCGAAVELLAMVAAHESGGFRYVGQVGGPARGLWQMEPVGYAEVLRYVELRPERFTGRLRRQVREREHGWLQLDQVFACRCARVFFMAEPAPLPGSGDVRGLAEYAKVHWNTPSGKATVDDYENAYREYTPT